jgi:hypothetical protein
MILPELCGYLTQDEGGGRSRYPPLDDYTVSHSGGRLMEPRFYQGPAYHPGNLETSLKGFREVSQALMFAWLLEDIIYSFCVHQPPSVILSFTL